MRQSLGNIFIIVSLVFSSDSKAFLVVLQSTSVITLLVFDVANAAERIGYFQWIVRILSLQRQYLLVIIESICKFRPLFVNLGNVGVRNDYIGIALLQDSKLSFESLVVRAQRRFKISGFIVEIAQFVLKSKK